MFAKKMGRPTDDPKPNHLHIRVNDEDMKTLEEYCRRQQKSRPEGVRDGIKALKDK